ncbi:MAG TPA: PspC domain-containing protein [Vicinamibacterales bacterium]
MDTGRGISDLNGVAYQVEEGGYEALVAYLGQAGDQLAGNPDRAEILADLEQAIADKCRAFLGPHKTVVTVAEIQQIIAEMGPVDGDARADHDAAGGAQSAHGGGADHGAPRRLFQIREGAMLSGVCNGLGAYFNLDPTIVRIIFILLAILTKGLWVFVYLVLMFVIPYAATPEERAAAHGWRFSAQEVIDRAKRQYAEFKEKKTWKRQWRFMRRHWRHQWRGIPWHPPPRRSTTSITQRGLAIRRRPTRGCTPGSTWCGSLSSRFRSGGDSRTCRRCTTSSNRRSPR